MKIKWWIALYFAGAFITLVYNSARDYPAADDKGFHSPETGQAMMQIMLSVIWPAFWFVHSAYLIADIQVTTKSRSES